MVCEADGGVRRVSVFIKGRGEEVRPISRVVRIERKDGLGVMKNPKG